MARRSSTAALSASCALVTTTTDIFPVGAGVM
jgi:hypothetical protein